MKYRKLTPELMDDPHVDEATLKAALAEVTRVNKYLGGQQVTLEGLRYFFDRFPQKSYTILDVGCGDGAMLRSIANFARKRSIAVKLIGIDINPKSIALAQKRSQDFPEVSFQVQDVFKLNETHLEIDIITSTLTMHHFTDTEILKFLAQFLKLANLGIVINDLQRSTIAYRLFQAYSRVFMRSAMARHDGLISIERAFTKNELLSFTSKLGVQSFNIKWRWAFRYLWILENQK
ncbi:methyltransferase domain-containing protein [Leeuwenhoekiella palythoae]|uniref:Methyltransferase domain-containing protein n=2 Tax=Leeuwenhoekiella palythoae TaxID=573501 RepID=A0A1M5ZKM7_9FLAO|nr:methyltransferase domain-containing protein [Leeuwenhoekiella palythoae]SHI24724.1 Methyltransferase domain-containing protein [Leeuwenhoekiella palythoae]